MTAAKLISSFALAVTIVSCLAYLFGEMSLATVKWVALGGTIAWFISAPIWIDRKSTG